MYVVFLLGNAILILVTVSTTYQRMPMYFFLGSPSILEIWYTTCSVPQIPDIFLRPKKIMPFSSCAKQMLLSFS